MNKTWFRKQKGNFCSFLACPSHVFTNRESTNPDFLLRFFSWKTNKYISSFYDSLMKYRSKKLIREIKPPICTNLQFFNIFFTILFLLDRKVGANCSASFVMKSSNQFYILKVPQNKFDSSIIEKVITPNFVKSIFTDWWKNWWFGVMNKMLIQK